jgi:CRISPR-associated protein Cas2
MSEYAGQLYLICYDIAEPRRLQRVHHVLGANALAVQYSVFLFWGSRVSLGQLMEKVVSRIDGREDDVRVYRVPERCYAVTLGAEPISPGLVLQDHELMRVLGPATRRRPGTEAVETGSSRTL